MIPKIIHQTWKDSNVPSKWDDYVATVKRLNPDWQYRLWTDEDNDAFVAKEYPEFLDIFRNLSRGIMRADIIRYLIMYKIGGVYLDLDYEMLKPFDFKNEELVIPLNRSIAFGDAKDELGNCIFASVPGHQFWKDVISDLQNNPPEITEYVEIINATGPGLLTRIFNEGAYPDVSLPDRIIYHPPSTNNPAQIRKIKNNGQSLGIHHHWGSWKERWSSAYLKKKLKKQIGKINRLVKK